MIKQNRWALITAVIIFIVGLIGIPMSSRVEVANVWFMVGLVFLIAAAFFVLAKGHLFVGWRRRRRRDEAIELPEKKISVRDVATIKNSPIVVNRQAWFCLINAVVCIALGVAFSL